MDTHKLLFFARATARLCCAELCLGGNNLQEYYRAGALERLALCAKTGVDCAVVWPSETAMM